MHSGVLSVLSQQPYSAKRRRARGKALYLEANSVQLYAHGNEIADRQLIENITNQLAS